MIEHQYSKETMPARVVVLGAGGFVGGTTLKLLEKQGVPVLALGRKDVDLTASNGAEKLSGILEKTDSLVIVSANAPCKNGDMLVENVQMMNAVVSAISKTDPLNQIVYISSDAVYHDSPDPLDETSCAAPGSVHGAMHVAREQILLAGTTSPVCILRPSLLYGVNDPHNGYGPNQFRRKAAAGQDITLFGEGEEQRDHVLIDDVAEIVRRCLMHCSSGVLNIATGEVASFKQIAELVNSHFEKPVNITGSPRSGPMPHNGYRPFDATLTNRSFDGFQYTGITEGIARVHKEMMEAENG